MRIRIFAIAAAAFALTAQAAPAKADELGAILDLASGVNDLTGSQDWNPCRIYRDLEKGLCEIRRLKWKAEQARRTATPLFKTSNERTSQKDSSRTAALRQCSAGNQYVCDQINMAPQQAGYILSRTR